MGVENFIKKMLRIIFKDDLKYESITGRVSKLFRLLEKFIRFAILAIVRASRLPFYLLNKKPQQSVGGLVEKLHSTLNRKIKIGVVRFDGLGDHILTIPILNSLSRDERIDQVSLFLPKKLERLFENKSVKIIPVRPFSVHYPIGRGKQFAHLLTISAIGQFLSWKLGRSFKGTIDLMVLPRWDADYALNARAFALGTSALTYGHDSHLYQTPFPVENHESGMLNYVVQSFGASKHELDHLHDFSLGLGIEEINFKGYGREFFQVSADTPRTKNKFVLHVGAADPKRRWPSENWKSLIINLNALTPRIEFLILGSELEVEDLKESLKGQATNVRFAFLEKSLNMITELATAKIFIGNDSGPMHLAASLDTPLVSISCHPMSGKQSHVNSPSRFGPRGSASIVCQPVSAMTPCVDGCESAVPHCILGVRVNQVLESVTTILKYSK